MKKVRGAEEIIMVVIKRLQELLKNRLGLALLNGSTKFQTKDIVQQIIGAVLFASPFIVTEELWNLANILTFPRIVLLVFFTIVNSVLIVYFTEYQKIKSEIENFDIVRIPMRLISLLVISYSVTASLLWMFGVIGLKITNLIWGIKLIVLASFFASIGASTADIIK